MVKSGRNEMKLGAMPNLFESYPRRRPYSTGFNSERVRFVPVLIDNNKNSRRSAIASVLRSSRLRERPGPFAKFSLFNKLEKSRRRSMGGFAENGSVLRKLAFSQRRGRGGSLPYSRGQYARGGGRGALRLGGGKRKNNDNITPRDGAPTRHPRKPWRGGQQRRGEQVTTEKLDEDLDRYMGEDARKTRLDTELDAYFANQPSELINPKSGETEAGEIMQ